MDNEIFDSLLQGAQEAVAHIQTGEISDGARTHKVSVPDTVDVAEIRKDIGMTQVMFAKTFGFSLNAVKHWEAHRRTPARAARVLLRTIAYSPDTVLNANMPS